MELLAGSGFDVHVFAYPVNPEAPFHFESSRVKCHYYQRNEYTTNALFQKVEALKPDLVVCSGWIDRGYLAVCKGLRREIKMALALDNQVPVTLKGWLALIRAKFSYRAWFKYAWVPGDPQIAYARKLGFEKDFIFSGFYSADIDKFQQLCAPLSNAPFPKRFVFVGRYIQFKGISDLWDVFSKSEFPGWELWCAGHGPLYEHRKIKDGIHHLGFVQPDEMDTFVKQGGVFVLPSYKEPWGVVVHEFAAAGYPLICSKAVGAVSAFLREGVNGYTMEAGDVKDLKAAMKKMSAETDESLKGMALESRRLSEKISPENWVDTIKTMLETN
jgi:glycosyltransferase involved in cell wall biosynthesis